MSSLFGIGGGGNVGASGSFYSQSIGQSLRFNDDDSAYLTRTPASAGNRRTFTFSCWVRRGNLGTRQTIFVTTNSAGNDFIGVEFQANNTLLVSGNNGSGSLKVSLTSNAVFRDTSAWYHIVVSFDTTQSTSTNRVQMYVNGVLQTFSSATYPLLDYDSRVNTTNQHNLGSFLPAAGLYLDGYLSDINFIDGTQLTAASFGETKDGIWIPKAYSGSYGTNGFYLSYKSSDLNTTGSSRTDPYGSGTDQPNNTFADNSGSGNHWTISGLVASDVVLDSPTNNFATFNPLSVQGPAGAGTYSATDGNLGGTTTSGSTSWVGTTFGLPSGKWYFEARSTGSTSGWPRVGFYSMGAGGDSISSITTETSNNLSSLRLVYNSGCGVEPFGSTSVTQITGSISSGDILQIAIDVDAGKIWYGVNNTYLASGNPATGANAIDDYTATTYNPVMPCVGTYNSQALPDLNFGQDSSFAGAKTAQGNADSNGIGDFYYAPPSGFLALASSNLPELDIIDGSEHFNPVLYTGNAGTQSITGLGLQPDWVWIKARNNSYSHRLFDSVRGATKGLTSNGTNAEFTESGVTSFDADGFSLGSATNSNGSVPFVAWNWKAGGTPTATNSAGAGAVPTSGSVMIDGVASTSALAGAIPATKISANTTAGFSVISYTGNGSSSQTVAHGLSSAPEFIIHKDRDTNSNNNQWNIYHAGAGDKYGYFLTNAFTGSAQIIPNGIDTIELKSNLVTSNESGDDFIMYAFHSVEGYSKVGSYTGNGSADGPMVFTGLRPSFILTKRSDSTSWWGISDNKRSTFNEVANTLAANANYAESVLTSDMNVDFLSNGFKIRDTSAQYNASGGTYIYLAIADQPFKLSNAR